MRICSGGLKEECLPLERLERIHRGNVRLSKWWKPQTCDLRVLRVSSAWKMVDEKKAACPGQSQMMRAGAGSMP